VGEAAVRAIVEEELPFGVPETAAWIESLPAGGLREAAVEDFCVKVRPIDPATALAWALTIGKPERQRDEVRRAAESWLEVDPEAARRWINETDAVSPETKKNLLK
jgi:hypothetical protein